MERGTAGDGGVATELESLERELIAALNAERARAGVRELTASVKLARAADYHSSEMIQGDYFAHESLNGWSFHERLRKLARARTAGEVLAYETLVSGDDLTAQAVVELWMSSPEHRAEVLKRTYNRVGVGLRTGPFQGSETAAVFTVDLGRLH